MLGRPTVVIGFELGQSPKEFMEDCKLEVLTINWAFSHFSMADKVVVIKAANRSYCIILELPS